MAPLLEFFKRFILRRKPPRRVPVRRMSRKPTTQRTRKDPAQKIVQEPNHPVSQDPRDDVEKFIETYLAAYCRLPFAPIHRVLMQWHGEMKAGEIIARRGRRYVMAAPRGSAKSTVASFALVLHDVVFQRERYIVLLSATERQARQRLRAISGELRRGPLSKLNNEGETRFTTGSILSHGVQVDAYGAGTEIRGITANGFRPTKIILDDAEASRAASSPRARERLLEWYTEIVEHLGDVYTHIVAVGTVLHERGLIATLMARPDFRVHRARSIESFATDADLWAQWRMRLMDFNDPDRRETARAFFLLHRAEMERGSAVLWPEKEDYEHLFTQLTLQGRRAFYQEKQNQPLGAEDALFDAERALRATENGTTMEIVSASGGAPIRRYEAFEKTARRFRFLDGAMGKGASRQKGDFAVLATVLLFPDRSLVLEDLWARRASPTEQVRRLFDAHAARPCERLAIEGTGFQELFTTLVEEERRARHRAGLLSDMPVTVLHPRRSKPARIASLEPMLANGTLALSPGLDEEFWEELANYPSTAHDDALDAAASAVSIALGTDIASTPPTTPGNRPRTSSKLRW